MTLKLTCQYFDVSGTFRSRLMDQHLSDAPRDIATITFGLAGDGPSRRYGSSSSICTPSLKFVGLPFETGANYCPWDEHLPTNFGVARTFRSRLISQHLSDASRDLATLTFEVTALVTDDVDLRVPSVY